MCVCLGKPTLPNLTPALKSAGESRAEEEEAEREEEEKQREIDGELEEQSVSGGW